MCDWLALLLSHQTGISEIMSLPDQPPLSNKPFPRLLAKTPSRGRSAVAPFPLHLLLFSAFCSRCSFPPPPLLLSQPKLLNCTSPATPVSSVLKRSMSVTDTPASCTYLQEGLARRAKITFPFSGPVFLSCYFSISDYFTVDTY